MIEHVGSSKKLYFHNLDGIIRFIQDELEIDKKPQAWFKKWQIFWKEVWHQIKRTN